MIKKEHYTHSYKVIITLFHTILSTDPLLHSLIGLNDLFYRMSVNKTHSRSNSKYDKIVIRELFNFVSKDRTGFVPFEVDSPRQIC